MWVKKLIVKGFKCFKDFEIIFKKDLNILAGDNEVGKSTILEALHLALTGTLNGRYLKYETLSQYLFNKDDIETWKGNSTLLPFILIEVYLEQDLEDSSNNNLIEGANNSIHQNACGLSFQILFDEEYREEYEAYMMTKSDECNTLPIEYYRVSWKSFADLSVTPRSIPIKSVLIDSTSGRHQDGSDLHVNRIIRENLEDSDKIRISQFHREMKDRFEKDVSSIDSIAKNDKNVKICVNLRTQNAWEDDLITHINDTPFHHIGKGQQCISKTELSLKAKKSVNAGVILIEEPENHLSHSKLNYLLKCIENHNHGKQIVISTHSSFVANKLNLSNLILINKGGNENKRNTLALADLSEDTFKFFQKLAGYDTLRLLLCKAAILVEGPSDELIVQRAYKDLYNKLPIEDEIEVISIGTSFLRFLLMGSKINKKISVITDNDGDIEALKKKYQDYSSSSNIKIYYDGFAHDCNIEDYSFDSKFNCNTLEPCLVRANNLEQINKILAKEFKTLAELHKYMKEHKTDCALQIFENQEKITYPQYILNAINHVANAE